MKKRSLIHKLFGDPREDKAFEKRFARLEKRQQAILRLLQRQAYADSEILAPEFAATGLSVSSMQGEDGHLLHIFKQIGVSNREFVEIGIQNGLECNTANLAFNFGWSGVLVEGNPHDAALAKKNYCCFPKVNVVESFVTCENVAELLKSAGANAKADLFSLDIDGNDYWIWEALADFHPRVAVLEYNSAFGPTEAVTIPYQSDFKCGGGKQSRLYYGASLSAMNALARRKGYALVGCSDLGPNAFFVRNDALMGSLKAVEPRDAYRASYLRRFNKKDAEALFGLPLVKINI